MAEKKRGLHRGLEALLVDSTLPKTAIQPPPQVAPEPHAQLAKAEQLIAALREENRQLLLEAATLADLLRDVESLLHRIEQE